MTRRISRRTLLHWMAAGTGAALVGPYVIGCSSGGSSAGQTQPSTPFGSRSLAPKAPPFSFAYKSDAFTLNPYMHTDTTTHVIQTQWFDRFVTLGRDGKFHGVLAESWEVADSTTFRFKLRKGVKFHNGDPFDAESVKFTFDYIADPANKVAAAPSFADYKESVIEDSHTVVIKLKQPSAAVLSMLSLFWPLPAKHIQKVGWEEFVKKPVGTGPFKFVEWSKDVHVITEPNPEYWGGAPKLGKVTYRPIPEDAARLAALMNGEVDFIAALPLDRVEEARQHPDLKVLTRPGQLVYTGLDTLKFEPFKNKLVRQALNYAINWDAIIKNLLGGLATRLNGPLHVQAPGYDKNLAPFPYEPNRAKTLLSEAGYANGFTFRLDVAVGFQATQKLKEVAEAMQADLAKVNIKANLNLMEPAAALEQYRAKQLQAYIFPWASSPESGRHIYTLLHSKTRGYYYQNPDADKIIEKYMQTVDPAGRVTLGKELVEFMRDDCPWIYMYQEPDIYGVRKNIQWEPNPNDYMVFVSEIQKTV